MGADACHLFFGLRYTASSDDEEAELENGTDARLQIARANGLKAYVGRLTDGEPSFLLIGHRIGSFGVENAHAASFTEEQLAALISEAKARLEAARFPVAEARIHVQLEADY